MQIKPATAAAVQLFHEGALALSQIEANGIRIDMDYLGKLSDKVDKDIRRLERELQDSKEYTQWRKRFGSRAKLGNHDQLGTVVFDILGYKRGRKKKVKNVETHEKEYEDANDQTAFEHVDIPFVKQWFEWQKLRKLRSPYISNMQSEVEPPDKDGYSLMHPFFDLHIPKTYRGSSSKPNFTNYPVRNPLTAELIRRSIIPRDGHLLGENDFGGIEVCIGACNHLDPKMIEFLINGYDYHKEYATKVYKIPTMPKEWWTDKKGGKNHRYCAKNKFIFPEFYGSQYVDNAPALWEAIGALKLEFEGKSVYEHLKKHGITELGECSFDTPPESGTFAHHVKTTAEKLWKLFHVYAKWKNSFFDAYLDKGWFELKTGFVCSGLYKKNEVTNYPIQGAAFHCLLWVLVEMQKWLRKYKMRTKILGQIHDCIVADIHTKELDDYLEKIKYLVEVALPKHWPWIIVPMKIEAEIAPEGRSWHSKRTIEI